MSQGQGAVVSTLKDIFNKRISQQESGSFGGHKVQDSRAAGTESIRGDIGQVGETAKHSDLPIILITNDDGIGAPGLRALVSALVDGGRCDVHVCAPDSERSASGHSITYRDNLIAEAVDMAGAKAYQISGTPADCVSLSLSGSLFSWSKPTLVISGINKGANCGYHVIYSGTVAGAREAFLSGVPAIAVSLDWVRGKSGESAYKAAAEVFLPLIYAALRDIEQGLFPKGCFFNVQIPAHPLQHKGYKVTKQGTTRTQYSWKSVTAQRRMNMAKESRLGAQLAQLGLAASAAGARRQSSSARTTPIEIESTGSAVVPDGSRQKADAQQLVFRMEMADTVNEVGEEDGDLSSLSQGYITVTPLGLVTSVPELIQNSVSTWMSSAAELSVPSSL